MCVVVVGVIIIIVCTVQDFFFFFSRVLNEGVFSDEEQLVFCLSRSESTTSFCSSAYSCAADLRLYFRTTAFDHAWQKSLDLLLANVATVARAS